MVLILVFFVILRPSQAKNELIKLFEINLFLFLRIIFYF